MAPPTSSCPPVSAGLGSHPHAAMCPAYHLAAVLQGIAVKQAAMIVISAIAFASVVASVADSGLHREIVFAFIFWVVLAISLMFVALVERAGRT